MERGAGAMTLSGIRVVEIADEQAEYCGLVLAGLGAEVIKVEPPEGNSTRAIGPFLDDVADLERSLFFWNYNRGKQSIALDLDDEASRDQLFDLVTTADVLLQSAAHGDRIKLDARFTDEQLREQHPSLVVARMSPFGDRGPWRDYRGSDLVHLALGGPMSNCGYTPRPDGTYDVPPIAPQMWHAYHIAGEQLAMMTLAALLYRRQTGHGQVLSCAVHEAVSKNTELDLMNWIMRRVTLFRQTASHAMETVGRGTALSYTKDGRWFMSTMIGPRDRSNLIAFLEKYGMAEDLIDAGPATSVGARPIPGSAAANELAVHTQEVFQRFVRRFTYAEMPWSEMQDAGVICVPLRKPEENVDDEHWQIRRTFSQIHHPEHDRSFTYVTSKWLSSETAWRPGRRAPLLDEDHTHVQQLVGADDREPLIPTRTWHRGRASVHLLPMALDGIRVLDFTWFLASAGGTRFLAALGAECLKVEWHQHPDTRFGAQAPVGGREARRTATSPLDGIVDADMGGQFNNKNSGKRGLSLNVRHPDGLKIAQRLVAVSDVVAEGFSPGVMERWGLGYDALREIKPDIIYAQQSGMGSEGNYGRFRAVGPIAAALAGTTEMSGLPVPALPAGWGYSYLDWIGAYSFATAVLAAIYHRDVTGRGQWLDASQTETGIFISGTSILDWSANGRSWERTGNRSPYKPAAPHGAYQCRGDDNWVALACFDERDWNELIEVAGMPAWRADQRFLTLADRLSHQDELDEVVERWTSGADRYDIMHRLQARGVAAGVCQTAADRCDADPQLAALNWLTEVTGTKIGRWPVAEVPVRMSETPPHIGGAIDRGAPCYGEDNDYVLGEILGYSTAEIEAFHADGVV
jgi:crotonobetainyl-CoA:carnitine CoA-transferase CaiB-like acyl-CoA transferase